MSDAMSDAIGQISRRDTPPHVSPAATSRAQHPPQQAAATATQVAGADAEQGAQASLCSQYARPLRPPATATPPIYRQSLSNPLTAKAAQTNTPIPLPCHQRFLPRLVKRGVTGMGVLPRCARRHTESGSGQRRCIARGRGFEYAVCEEKSKARRRAAARAPAPAAGEVRDLRRRGVWGHAQSPALHA